MKCFIDTLLMHCSFSVWLAIVSDPGPSSFSATANGTSATSHYTGTRIVEQYFSVTHGHLFLLPNGTNKYKYISIEQVTSKCYVKKVLKNRISFKYTYNQDGKL